MIREAVIVLFVASSLIPVEVPLDYPSNMIYAIHETDTQLIIGTAKGAIVRDSPSGNDADSPQIGAHTFGEIRMIDSINIPLLRFESAGDGRIAAGSAAGPMYFDPLAPNAKPIRVPLMNDLISSVARVSIPDGKCYFGGASGLMELTKTGKVVRVELPGSSPGMTGPIVTALAASGPDLYVAVDGAVYLFRSLRNEWITIASGSTYSDLLLLNEKTIVALRIDGTIDLLTARAGSARAATWNRRPWPVPTGAVVTAIASSKEEQNQVLWIGTFRGRLFAAPVLPIMVAKSFGEENPSWEAVLGDDALPATITAILKSRAGNLIVGTAGHGFLLLSENEPGNPGSFRQATLFVSNSDRIHALPSGEPDPTLTGIHSPSPAMSALDLLRARIGRLSFASLKPLMGGSGASPTMMIGLALIACAIYFLARGFSR